MGRYGANLTFLRPFVTFRLHTVDIAGGEQGIKECIECWATPYRLAHTQGCDAGGNGSFSCCGAGGVRQLWHL